MDLNASSKSERYDWMMLIRSLKLDLEATGQVKGNTLLFPFFVFEEKNNNNCYYVYFCRSRSAGDIEYQGRERKSSSIARSRQ